MSDRKTWKQRIEQAKERGKFTQYDDRVAEGWNHCAVGERLGFLHLTKEEAELEHFSEESTILGMDFAQAVWNNNIPEAERIYNEIQKLPNRAANA